MLRRTALVLGLGLVLAACSGATNPPDGPLKAGVVSGNNQVVQAARLRPLPQQVGAQVVRLPNGTVSLRTWITDALTPRSLEAQTAVQGVPNQTVCTAQPRPGDQALKADIPCATSNASGIAYLTMLQDTVAGSAIARIGMSTSTGTVITDSVTATILPGPVDPNYRTSVTLTPIQNFPAVVTVRSVLDAYGNPIPFRIVPDGRITVQDTAVGSVGARTIVSGPVGLDAGGNPQDYVVELRGANNVLVGHARYQIAVAGRLEEWLAAGVNLAP